MVATPIGTITTTGDPSTEGERSAVRTKSPVARTGNGSTTDRSPVRLTTGLPQEPIATRPQSATDENLGERQGDAAKRNSNADGNGPGKAASPEEEGDKGRRPCDMCRKRKVSLSLSCFFRRVLPPIDLNGNSPRSNVPHSTNQRLRHTPNHQPSGAGDATTSTSRARTSTSINAREDHRRRIEMKRSARG